MKTLTLAEAMRIGGNVEGGNTIGNIEMVIYAARRNGYGHVVISRPGVPYVGDEEFWGDDTHLRVNLYDDSHFVRAQEALIASGAYRIHPVHGVDTEGGFENRGVPLGECRQATEAEARKHGFGRQY